MPKFFPFSVTLLALLVPALALVSSDGGPAILYVSALLATMAMGANAFKRWEPFDFHALSPLVTALGAPLLAMLVTSVMLGLWRSSEFEKLVRFALAIPLAWVLLRSSSKALRQVQWSLLFGAYAGSLMLIAIMLTPGLGRAVVSEYGGRYNAVAFADLTLFFGLASYFTLPWTLSRWPRLEAALKLLAVPLSIYALWVSQTRSSWALFVVFGGVVLVANRQWRMHVKASFASALMAIMMAGAAFAWHSEESRFSEVWKDLQRYEQHDRDTSTGIRLQLWHASWLMFKQNPWAGVGASNFRAELAELNALGIVTPRVASDFGEPHNDFLGALAAYGMLGFLSIVALYFVPALVFLRRLSSADAVVHAGAKIGVLFTLGYAMFSMTEMMFRNMRSVPIYAVTLVVLYALTRTPAGAAADKTDSGLR